MLTYPQARTISEIRFLNPIWQKKIFCLGSEDPILYQSQKFIFPLSQYSLTPELIQEYLVIWKWPCASFRTVCARSEIMASRKIGPSGNEDSLFLPIPFWDKFQVQSKSWKCSNSVSFQYFSNIFFWNRFVFHCGAFGPGFRIIAKKSCSVSSSSSSIHTRDPAVTYMYIVYEYIAVSYLVSHLW